MPHLPFHGVLKSFHQNLWHMKCNVKNLMFFCAICDRPKKRVFTWRPFASQVTPGDTGRLGGPKEMQLSIRFPFGITTRNEVAHISLESQTQLHQNWQTNFSNFSIPCLLSIWLICEHYRMGEITRARPTKQLTDTWQVRQGPCDILWLPVFSCCLSFPGKRLVPWWPAVSAWRGSCDGGSCHWSRCGLPREAKSFDAQKHWNSKPRGYCSPRYEKFFVSGPVHDRSKDYQLQACDEILTQNFCNVTTNASEAMLPFFCLCQSFWCPDRISWSFICAFKSTKMTKMETKMSQTGLLFRSQAL